MLIITVHKNEMKTTTSPLLCSSERIRIYRRCCLLLVCAILLGETTTVKAFVASPPSSLQKIGAKRIALSLSQGHECRKRAILGVSNDPRFEKQDDLKTTTLNDTNSLPESRMKSPEEESWIDRLFLHPILQPKSLTSPNPPPLQVEDTDLLFFDVFLLLNLTVSISYFVVHRLNFTYLSSALGEGSLLCILWIASGLYHGSFLFSAVDGHFRPGDKASGPMAACMLGLHTYITTINLRLLVALAFAFLEHRPVGASPSEMLMPLEAGFGLLLMSVWRFLHSTFTPRI